MVSTQVPRFAGSAAGLRPRTMSSKRATIGALEGVLPGVVGARRGFPPCFDRQYLRVRAVLRHAQETHRWVRGVNRRSAGTGAARGTDDERRGDSSSSV